MLKAKGFSEVYVRIDDDTVDVVVDKEKFDRYRNRTNRRYYKEKKQGYLLIRFASLHLKNLLNS